MTLVSENTFALLLLTAPLILGDEDGGGAKILSLSETNKLVRQLENLGARPIDLLGDSRPELIKGLAQLFPGERIVGLLDRVSQATQALDKWTAHGIWIINRTDSDYPEHLKSNLKEHAPILIYGCGDINLLQATSIAVVGSRNADEQSLEFTQSVGRLAAAAGITVISGGAKGVDRAAMGACLDSGGTAVGVLAEQLFRQAAAPDCREFIGEGRLALISLVDPSARFNVGNAMQRNKIIYALGEIGLIVCSDVNKGGTWAGAIEQIERFKSCAIYVRSSDNGAEGNRELQSRGALAWPQPATAEDLKILVNSSGRELETLTPEPDLPLFALENQ